MASNLTPPSRSSAAWTPPVRLPLESRKSLSSPRRRYPLPALKRVLSPRLILNWTGCGHRSGQTSTRSSPHFPLHHRALLLPPPPHNQLRRLSLKGMLASSRSNSLLSSRSLAERSSKNMRDWESFSYSRSFDLMRSTLKANGSRRVRRAKVR